MINFSEYWSLHSAFYESQGVKKEVARLIWCAAGNQLELNIAHETLSDTIKILENKTNETKTK